MPEFIVLEHDSPDGLHFDLMLCDGEVLKTWALPSAPQQGKTMACRVLPDHRPAYLNYEGPVSGGRGTVTRWDRGHYETLAHAENQWVVTFTGSKLTGRATLTSIDQNTGRWQFAWIDT